MIFIVGVRLFLYFFLFLLIAHNFTKVIIEGALHRILLLFGLEVIVIVIVERVEFVDSNVLFLFIILVVFLVRKLPSPSLLLFLLFLQYFLPHLDHVLSLLIAFLVDLVDHNVTQSGLVVLNCSLILLIYLTLLRLHFDIRVSVMLVEISLLECFPYVHQSQHRTPNSPDDQQHHEDRDCYEKRFCDACFL